MGNQEVAGEIRRKGIELAQGRGARRPMYEAAKSVVEERNIAREAALEARLRGEIDMLDPELFPPDVFNEDGTRQEYTDGNPKNTYEEDRMYFEFRDSRM